MNVRDRKWNKTGASKVGARSKDQKAQNTFFENNMQLLKLFLSENVA